jgi:hypothetical protein
MAEFQIHVRFPMVYCLIELVLLLPMAMATSYMVFSALKIDLIMCYIERGIFKSLNLGYIKGKKLQKRIEHWHFLALLGDINVSIIQVTLFRIIQSINMSRIF